MLEQAGYVAASPVTRPRRTRTSSSSTRARSARTRPTSSTATSAGSPALKRGAAGHADRGRRLPGAEGPRGHRRAGAVGRRRVRHAQPRRPAGPAGARAAQRARRRSRSRSRCKVFPCTLPTRRESVYAGWVSISVGCNNTCTFCIVPHLRGKERDRRPGEILAEVEALVAAGRDRGDAAGAERELLRRRVRRPRRVRQAAARLPARSRASSGCASRPRTRPRSPTTSSRRWPQTPTVMPQLHMPLQSGSDRILRAMRRSYRSEKFLGILDRVRAAMPDAAITTDIIVGFPGETEEDFAETLRVVEAVPVRLRVHVPVLAAPRHARRATCPTSCPRPSCRSGSCG